MHTIWLLQALNFKKNGDLSSNIGGAKNYSTEWVKNDTFFTIIRIIAKRQLQRNKFLQCS